MWRRLPSFCLYGGSSQTDWEFYAEYAAESDQDRTDIYQKLTDPNPDGATLLAHLVSSLKIVLSGYLLGVVIGVPLGIVMAWYEKADLMVRPVFDMIRTVPGIAWVPVMVVFLGIGFTSKAVVIFIGAVVANVINAYSGIKQTKQVHLW